MKKTLFIGSTLFLSTTLLTSLSALASQSSPSPNQSTTKVNTVLSIEDNSIPVPPIGEEGGGDKSTEMSGPFGIAYVPELLSTKVQLKEEGTQRISLKGKTEAVKKYNVGVKDSTRKKDQEWSLKASLNWTNDHSYMKGTSIESQDINVRKNTEGILEELDNKEVVPILSNLKITSSETEVMKSVKGKTINGVYNYQFSNPELVIPDVSKVPSGMYKGNIHWNLSNEPSITPPEESTELQAQKKVDALFNGEELQENVTQETINEASYLVEQLENSDLKTNLQERIALAQKLLDAKPIKKELFVTKKPTNTLDAGIKMGNGHDRQDLGIQIEKDSKIKIKQVNPNFQGNLTLRLLTDDSHTESAITFSNNEATLSAKALSVPFVDTPYMQGNGESPIVEFTVEGSKRELPKYQKNMSKEIFSNKWNQEKGFALIQGQRFQTLFPEMNKEKVLSSDLNQVIKLYDEDIIGYYNQLIGLSDNAGNPINQSSNRRYFYKADRHGAGGLYYGELWSAQSSASADAWLSDGWGVLHETGHGYQGNFMSRGMDTGEVWNNLYGVIYNYKKLGREEADRNTWLYDFGKKSKLENHFKNLVNNNQMNYNQQGQREKLIILSNLIDKSGENGLSNFYTRYRELATQPGYNPSNHLLPDLLVKYLGEPSKYDFSAVLSAWQTKIKNESMELAKKNGYKMVSHLAQVVPDNRLDEAITRFTQRSRLSSVLSLVTNEELDTMNLKSNVTLKFPEVELFEGTKLKIYRDNKLYTEVPLNKESVTIEDMPNGVYSLELDNKVGYIQKPYLFVKDNQSINISLVNYVKEATQAVQSLYQEDTGKIKPTIMQKDIDQAKQYVNALPESKEKEALLNKLETAFNQLQEITFGGLSDWHFATLDVSNSHALIRINNGKPHSYFNTPYASILVNRGDKEIYKKDFVGDINHQKETIELSLQEGDIMTLMHKEYKNKNRFFSNHSELLPTLGETVKFVVKNGQLTLLK
ncbi:toxin Cry1Ac domain D-VI-related protein [Enterococcus faecium]|nr:toxin Cry1Ac domain D-VI-related protein [Enterococcus faecium]